MKYLYFKMMDINGTSIKYVTNHQHRSIYNAHLADLLLDLEKEYLKSIKLSRK